MKNTFLILLTALLSLTQSGQVFASQPFNELVVFGDSLSDSGNVFKLTTDSPAHVPDPPPPVYFDGRASNGPNWIDLFADQLNISRPAAYLQDPLGTNYAFAGAATGSGTSTRFPSPTYLPNPPLEVDNVGTQINSFLTNNGSFQNDQLVTLWAGAGDLAKVTGVSDIVTIVDNLEGHIRAIDSKGAKTVIVPNQLDSGLAPFFDLPGTPDPIQVSGAVNILNNLLNSRLISLATDPELNINIIAVDMAPLIQEILDSGDFVNTDNAWLIDFSNGEAESADPNDYFFLDAIHPSAKGHGLIANKIAASVIPTPPTIFLLTFGALIFNFQRRKINQIAK